MPEYHIAKLTLDGNRIYAGILSKSGRLWLHKSDVTSEFWETLIALAAGYDIIVKSGGKRWSITVAEIRKHRSARAAGGDSKA